MITTIREGRLQFQFGSRWQIVKLDDHPAYRNRIAKLSGTKAVDILGILDARQIYLFEIKDFRQHRIENKDRSLPEEIGQKVLGTIGCIVGAHKANPFDIWHRYLQLLENAESNIYVIIWVERSPEPSSILKQKVKRSMRAKNFKRQLGWLTQKVRVVDHKSHKIEDLHVSNISRT